jgi:putative hemolysin
MNDGTLLAMPEVTALVLVLSIFGSAFFSGCETGLMTASRVRLQRMAAAGQSGAAALMRQRERLDDAVLTCLLGTNLSNVLASAVATALLIEWLGPRGEFIAIMVASLVLVILGEILPKVLYREYPEQLTRHSLPLLEGFRLLSSPVRWPLSAYAKLLQRLQGHRPVHRPGLDRATLATLLAAGGVPQTRDRRFQMTMVRFLRLSNRRVADIMRPLDTVRTVPQNVTLSDALSTAADSGFSRLPVVGTGGDLAGYLLVRDLLLAEGSIDAHLPVPAVHVRPLLLVDSALSPYELFEDLHARGAQFAAVVDRAGRALGIITLEDLVEEVTGAIADEFDQTEKLKE